MSGGRDTSCRKGRRLLKESEGEGVGMQRLESVLREERGQIRV